MTHAAHSTLDQPLGGNVVADNLENFLRTYAHVIEHSPWIIERAWDLRPFSSGDALHAAICRVLRSLDNEERVHLISAHPELADRVAIAHGMTPDSVSEQASAGLDRLTPVEFDTFQELNGAYRRRNGFPFIICARLYNKEQILSAMRHRLAHSPSEELQEAIEQITQICRFRLQAVLST